MGRIILINKFLEVFLMIVLIKFIDMYMLNNGIKILIVGFGMW